MGSLTSYVVGFDERLGQVNASAPKVSIVVTNYNYADYIVDCLHSVSRQDYPEIECIIVDDASTDGSVDRITQFLASGKSQVDFKLITHEETRGQLEAFFTGFVASSGVFITFLDADDLLLSNFISEHVRAHVLLAPVAFTSSNQFQIDSSGQVIGGVHPDLQTRNTIRSVGTISLQHSFWVWATTSSMMFRRSVLRYILTSGGDEFKKCADNYVAHFCNLLGGSILLPTTLGCYRRHQRNTFSTNPLIGGRLPTGDMRQHPAHRLVLECIQRRLIEETEAFVALLGYGGFLHLLAKVTRPQEIFRNALAVMKSRGWGVRSFYSFCYIIFVLYLRRMVRLLRKNHPGVVLRSIEGTTRVEKITSTADYQRHRRHAK